MDRTKASKIPIGVAVAGVFLAAMVSRADAQTLLSPRVEPNSRSSYELVTETQQTISIGGQTWPTEVMQTMILERSTQDRESTGELWITFKPLSLKVEIKQGEHDPRVFDWSRESDTVEHPAETPTDPAFATLLTLVRSTWRVRIDEEGEVVGAEGPPLDNAELDLRVREALERQLNPERLMEQAQRDLHPFPPRPIVVGDTFSTARTWNLTSGDKLEVEERRRYGGTLGQLAERRHRVTWTYANVQFVADEDEDAENVPQYKSLRIVRGNGELLFDANEGVVTRESRELVVAGDLLLPLRSGNVSGEVEWQLSERIRLLEHEANDSAGN